LALLFVVWIFTIVPFPADAQDNAPLVTLDVAAGFDGYFREYQWMPVVAQLSNEGAGIQGKLTVRPATSGAGVPNPYTIDIDLPTGARQTTRLYVTAAASVTQIRVEFISHDGVVIASAQAALRPIQSQDRLAVVISGAIRGTVDLSGIKTGSGNGYQANLQVDDVPDRPGLLDSVDFMLFSDIDTGSLSGNQRSALADWVAIGRHLIVTGGPNWQATVAGLLDLLPLRPTNVQTADNLTPLMRWMGKNDDLDGQTIVATGRLAPGGRALIETAEGTPLLARWSYGAGVVDYLAADPANVPLRGWDLMPEFWYAIASSIDPLPSWGYGFTRWSDAAAAVEQLPGLDLLPDALPLFGFLALYIVLIGPLNYFILNRLNRRELAWLTIPSLIAIFTLLAYLLGTSLRGNQAILSRLMLVRTWPDIDTARVDAVAGILSPRRSEYSFSVPHATLRPLPLPRQIGVGLLATTTQLSAEVNQGQEFTAQGFTVDASFMGNFTAAATIPRPSISGEATILDDPTTAGQQTIRGVVINDSPLTLTDPVVLARGVALRLENPLEPGDVVDFELTLPGEGAPAPVLYAPPPQLAPAVSNVGARQNWENTVVDLLAANANTQRGDARDELVRRRSFLTSFIRDAFASGGRGSDIYLAAWTDTSSLESSLIGAEWRAQDISLYLVAFETSRAASAGDLLISADQFSWVVRSFSGLGEIAPVEMRLNQSEELIIRFTPLAGAVLDEVRELYLVLDEFSTGSRTLPLAMRDWASSEWVELRADNRRYRVPDHRRFLGPENAVEIRLRAEDNGGFVRINRLAVEQVGRFAG
jgi:hypothetical protein